MDVEEPVQGGTVLGASYDKSADTLTLGEWTLHRQ